MTAVIISILERLGERRAVNPARTTAESIRREHMADMAEIQRQAQGLVDRRHDRAA